MKRMIISRLKYLIGALLLCVSLQVQAQDVRVTVECPATVRVGEPFQLGVTVNAQSSQPQFPSMSDFQVLSSMGTSQSFSSSYVNGQMQASVNITYSYAVKALKEGVLEFPTVEVTAGGKKYRSQPVAVQAVAGSAQGQQGQTQSGQARAQQGQSQQSGAAVNPSNAGVQTNNRDIFVSVIPSRTKLYQGESLTATVKLFARKNIRQISDLKLPSFNGFFKQEIPTPQLRELQRETINGQVYGTGVLQQYSLFPQKSGTLVINPCEMKLLVEQRVQSRARDPFDDFFGDFFSSHQVQSVPYDIKSSPVHITVMPLPEGKPASFTGGVGQMKMVTSVDTASLKANEPITFKVTLSGTGNLKITDAPRINFPPDFEVYDPKVSTNLNTQGTSGSKTFEYLIIPRHGGVYRLPAVEFSYFDPQARSYKTLHSSEYTLNVAKGAEQGGATMFSGLSREQVQFSNDIHYIKTGDIRLSQAGNFFGSLSFWLWYLLSAAAFATVVYLRRKYILRYADVAQTKHRRAGRYASKRLKRARSFLNANRSAELYEELTRALWGYLSDKLNIPIADLSRDNGKQMLLQHGVDETVADNFIAVIDDCEFARYAPSSAGSDMKTLYGRAEEAINQLRIKN